MQHVHEWNSTRIKREDPEGYKKAKAKYETDCKKQISDSDFWSGFDFVLDTYGMITWKHYFAE
jgi:hypothetical protein